jgi:hypothetical protein
MSARESILTCFGSVRDGQAPPSHLSSVALSAIKTHDVLFTHADNKVPEQIVKDHLQELRAYSEHSDSVQVKMKSETLRKLSAYLAFADIAALLDYGAENAALRSLFNDAELTKQKNGKGENSVDATVENLDFPPSDSSAARYFNLSRTLCMESCSILMRTGNENFLPYVHIFLTFLSGVTSTETSKLRPYLTSTIFDWMPWTELCAFLNELAASRLAVDDFMTSDLIWPLQNLQPLFEDYWIRGQVWSPNYFPKEWFHDAIEQGIDEREFETVKADDQRVKRTLYLGLQLSRQSVNLFPHSIR